MDLEIRHLQLVAGIARDGSMTKAASGLHLTQSALSHQLRDRQPAPDSMRNPHRF